VQTAVLQFLIPSLLPLAVHRTGGQIDYAAHFGGAIAGAAAGFFVLKIWPRDSVRPRFTGLANAGAVLTVVLFAGGVGLVAKSHAALAEELSIPPVTMLVKDTDIPEDITTAMNEVERWGKDFPHDPRVHLFRAMAALDRGDLATAEKEFEPDPVEAQLLKAYFPDGKLEKMMAETKAQVLQLKDMKDDQLTAQPPGDPEANH
jgi:rhomboid protease GluP